MFERSIKGSIKDSTKVALIAQWRMLAGASHLLGVAIVPMLVMMVPVLLVLGQLSLWYQYRPLRVGEVAVVTLKRRGVSDSLGDVKLNPPSSVELMAGPARIFS